jgi:hypothetical protein|tara:strand:- start:6397 stop:6870 length:474 start_codon:yes stop_codon:yes gene_type:complete
MILNVKNPMHKGVDLGDLVTVVKDLMVAYKGHPLITEMMTAMTWDMKPSVEIEAKDIVEGIVYIDVKWDTKVYLCPIRMRLVFTPSEYDFIKHVMVQRLMQCVVDLQNLLARLPEDHQIRLSQNKIHEFLIENDKLEDVGGILKGVERIPAKGPVPE